MDLKCPICKTDLVITGQDRLETLEEHVFASPVALKDVYQCPKTDCIAHIDDIRWNSYGESYYSNITKNYPFIDNNDAPFGSIQRRANVEIRKHDEDFYLFRIKNTGLKVIVSYTSNNDGDILKRKYSLQWIYKSVIYISGIRMLWFSLETFYMDKRRYAEDPTTHNTYRYSEHFTRPSWDKRWWRYLSVWFINTFHRRPDEQVQNN